MPVQVALATEASPAPETPREGFSLEVSVHDLSRRTGVPALSVSGTRRVALVVMKLAGVGALAACSRSAARPAPAAEGGRAAQAHPLILADADGERRVHRPPPGSLSNLAAPFIIKVDRRNGGAPEFVLFTEDIPPGQTIPPHHHPDADEILFVHAGSGIVTMDGRVAPVSAGAIIYMPRNTGVRLRNTGTQPLRIMAIFSQPGYEEYMRDISVAEGQAAPAVSVAELTAIRARHHAHVRYDQP